MAVYTKHAVSAPPAAPVREKTGHLLLRGWCIFVLVTALAASGWNNLLGPVGLGILVGVMGIISIALWALPARTRGADATAPRLAWRRLPWLPLIYVAWAGVSMIWSAWPVATLITWAVLAFTTLHGLFVASMLSWRELVRAVASALKWVLSLSILIELWVAVVVRHGILPTYIHPSGDDFPKELFWVRGELFDGGRLQGIMGNANLLGMAALLAIIVFAVRIAARAPRRGWLIAWIVLAAFLMVRASSATVYLAAVAAAAVLATALLMRTARKPGDRTKWYVMYAVLTMGAGILLWLFRDTIFTALGRSGSLTGRDAIWSKVLERAWEQPVIGWGFSTPWLPMDPEFDGWIMDHNLTVFMAHNMWIDSFFQLGFVGAAILAAMYVIYLWRAWFFAVDRPRWDLVANRPYSALTLLPTLVGTVLLVQGLTESRPLMEWGWMFVVMLSFKIKQSPIVGAGPAEQSAAIERG